MTYKYLFLLQTSASAADKLTDKLRSNRQLPESSSSSLTISTTPRASADTLSELLNSSNQIINDKTLDLNVQDIIEYPPDSSINIEQVNDEFFEALENVEYTVNENIVRDLLDASSDFQLVEDHTFTEIVKKSNEEKTCNVDFEKSVIEQIKVF